MTKIKSGPFKNLRAIRFTEMTQIQNTKKSQQDHNLHTSSVSIKMIQQTVTKSFSLFESFPTLEAQNSKVGRRPQSKKTFTNWYQRQNPWTVLKDGNEDFVAICEMISAVTGSCCYKNEIKKSISIWDLFSTCNLKMQISGFHI